MKKRYISALSIVLLIVVSFYFFSQKINSALHQPADLDSPILFVVERGSSLYSVFNQLDAQEIYKNSIWLKLAVKLNNRWLDIKAGTYEVSPQIPLSTFLKTLVNGDEKQFLITLVEGLTAKQWLIQLNNQAFLSSPVPEQELAQWVVDKKLPGEHIEGWLMPDTYAATYGTPVISIIERAYLSMVIALEELWETRYPGLPYKNAYEALIMASIIEKETGVPEERAHISGVFVNRLDLNMRLQTDPTVIYGIGDDFDGDITRHHLQTYTPYNTYKIKGLPPTPIAMASLASLQAAFNPMQTDDLYFVAKGDGTHYFSTTLEQHNQAVRQYQLGIKE